MPQKSELAKTKSAFNSGRAKKERKPMRTNTHCLQCKRELRKNEGEVCDECRMSNMGWKKN